MLNPAFRDPNGIIHNYSYVSLEMSIILLLYSMTHMLFGRPHDRVSLKEMKEEWHACLSNKVGFKVTWRLRLF